MKINADVGDIVWAQFDDGSGGPRVWTRWLAEHGIGSDDTQPISIVIIMKGWEVKQRIEAGGVI